MRTISSPPQNVWLASWRQKLKSGFGKLGFMAMMVFLFLVGFGLKPNIIHGQTSQEPDYKAMAEYLKAYDYIFEGTVVDFKGPVKLKDKNFYNILQVKITSTVKGNLIGQYVEVVQSVTGEVVDPETSKTINFPKSSHGSGNFSAKVVGKSKYFLCTEAIALQGFNSIKGTNSPIVLDYNESWRIFNDDQNNIEMVEGSIFLRMTKIEFTKFLNHTFPEGKSSITQPTIKKKDITDVQSIKPPKSEIWRLLAERKKLINPNRPESITGTLNLQIVNQTTLQVGNDNFLSFDVEYKTDAGGRYADRVDFIINYNSGAFGTLTDADITVTYPSPFNNVALFYDAIDFPPVSPINSFEPIGNYSGS